MGSREVPPSLAEQNPHDCGAKLNMPLTTLIIHRVAYAQQRFIRSSPREQPLGFETAPALLSIIGRRNQGRRCPGWRPVGVLLLAN
jgi:hypothetical protein